MEFYLLRDLGCAGMVREGYVLPQNIGESRITILSLERSSSVEHLVYQDAKGPPIDGTGVAASFDDLGSDVLFCPHKAVRPEVRNATLRVDCGHIAGRRIRGNASCVRPGGIGVACCE